FDWSVEIQGYILAASSVGLALFQIPTGFLIRIAGGKFLYGLSLTGISIASLFTALAACWSEYALMTLRFIHGCLETSVLPTTMILLSKWSPAQEKSKLVTCSIVGLDVGTILGFSLSGFISSSIGWPFIYYIFGGCELVFALLWVYLITEDPESHPTISKEELDYINRYSLLDDHSQKEDLPWKDILTSLPLWSLLIANFAVIFIFYSWISHLPQLLNSVLHMNIVNNGMTSSLPHICAATSTLFAGWLSDFLENKYKVSSTLLRKLYIFFCLALDAVLFLVASFILESQLVLLCILLVFFLQGFIWSAVLTNNLDLSAEYSWFIAGSICLASAISGILGPSLNGIILGKGGLMQWKIVFYMDAAVCLIGGIVYATFGSAEDQRWGKREKKFVTDIMKG
ncbi:hypothetical protein LOTGIDRAFT_104455, partial [Lottia gigantea]